MILEQIISASLFIGFLPKLPLPNADWDALHSLKGLLID